MILDHLEGLELSKESASRFPNEFGALGRLQTGIRHIAEFVASQEARIPPQMSPLSVSIGNSPQVSGIPMALVEMHFHWYAISVCSYVDLVGFLAKNSGYPVPTDYDQTVLGVVWTWRNKVAAHFALVHPRQDSAAAQAQSVMPQIGVVNGRFQTQPFWIRTAGVSTKGKELQWELTTFYASVGRAGAFS